MKTVIFRVDAGRVEGVSMGHAERAMMLGLHFLVDHLVYFVMRDYPEGVRFVRDSGFQVLPMDPTLTEERMLLPLVEEHAPSLVITDIPRYPGTNVFARCREMGIPTAAFDTWGRLAGEPDVIVNSSAVPAFTRYAHLNGSTECLVGPHYHMLRSVPDPQDVNDRVWNVLLTCGGSDPAGLTLRSLEALTGAPFGYTLHVVLGPAFGDRDKVLELVDRAQGRVVVQEIPEDFIGLLSRADMVVTACGQTLYESAALGRPTIMLPAADHEEDEAAFFESKAGFLNVGRWNGPSSGERLRECVHRLRDVDVRRRLHRAGQAIVDRGGTLRVARRLRDLAN